MPVFVLQNQLTGRLIADLQRIADDPTFVVDIGFDPTLGLRGTGQVSFAGGPVVSSPGTFVLDALLTVPAWIGIRAEASSFSVFPSAGRALRDIAGTVAYDQYPAPNVIDVVYDATECGGQGFWVDGGGGSRISLPRDVLLFHELAHAFDLAAGSFDAGSPETSAINWENQYRQFYNLPRRASHAGGCPRAAASTGGGGSGCFLASAALGSDRCEPIPTLRSVRDTIIRQTVWGRTEFEHFYKRYAAVSPLLIAQLGQDERLRQLIVHGIVGPVALLARIVRDFPMNELPEVGEPWRSFLVDLRDQLQAMTSFIEPTTDFSNLTPRQAALEAGVALRFLLRRPEDRTRYLGILEASGQLPVALARGEKEVVASQLREFGIENEVILAIVEKR